MKLGFFDRKRAQFLIKVVSRIQFGSVHLILPNGEEHNFNGPEAGPAAHLHLHSMNAMTRIMRNGKMGFCEAVMDGEASSNDLPSLIELAVLHDEYIDSQLKAGFLRKNGLRLFHYMRRNNKSGSAKNISYHYDLGNDFYAAWLDGTMTYSSAVFEGEDDDLSAAQINKYRHLAEMADIQPGDHVLEIGCGWGGFAKYVTSTIGAKVTGITISKEQFDFAEKQLAEAGLSDKAQLRLIDYRDLEGKFDKIVSIEMFEAVGEAYWPTYFAAVSSLLKKGGRAVIQSITINHQAFAAYKAQPDFIQRYIFPGGMLPSMELLNAPVDAAGLKLVEDRGYALHYARTLAEWRTRFNAAWPQLAKGKFDDRFKRMWELYLAYCEGGFRAGMIDVKQILLTHK
ncbi:cyclopropane-fatty-acyl-phospholipid synthase family protein [Alphaproteobacteria bacterium]|nr:cyclopropane-fatty-acyl-phospholipid synthase family protein [Alphaproteobacteria bacterium]